MDADASRIAYYEFDANGDFCACHTYTDANGRQYTNRTSLTHLRRIPNACAAYACAQRNPECDAGNGCALHKYCVPRRADSGSGGAACR